ncbi:MAG TPA: AMP-binding protein [Bacillota bacterium]|nr:AMP-binding protein [Bacillota bacterium]
MNLSSLISTNALAKPDRTAVICGDTGRKYSWAKLDEYVNKLGTALKSLGIEQGEMVAIYLPNSPEFLLTYFALNRIGAVTVPFNILFKTREIAHIINDSKARVLIGSADEVESYVLADRDRFARLEKIITVGRPLTGTIDFQTLLSYPCQVLEPAACSPDDIVSLMYTSGTTGEPKGAMLSFGNLLKIGILSSQLLTINDQDLMLTGAPFCHIFFVLTVLGPFNMGAGLITMKRFNPEKALELISAYRATHFAGVPTMYIYMLDKYESGKYDLTSWRFAQSAGASLPVETFMRIRDKFGVQLCEGYGATETSSTITYNRLGHSKAGSVGPVAAGVQAKVVDDWGNQLRTREIGEVLVKGPGVFKGYWQMPEATAKVLQGEWYWTGDLGWFDEEGYLYIVDRKKDMIVCCGYNVYPLEVEKVIYQHSKVLEAVVVGIKDPVRNQIPKAFVRLRNGVEMTSEEMIDFCAQQLASYKVPRAVEFVRELPKSPTGKILRRAL